MQLVKTQLRTDFGGQHGSTDIGAIAMLGFEKEKKKGGASEIAHGEMHTPDSMHPGLWQVRALLGGETLAKA
jgi:hypothetical protein